MSDSAPVRAADVAFRAVGDEMLLVSAGQGRVLSVNTLGAFVWELVDGEKSVSDIVTAVTEGFEVAEDVARHDVEAFLEDLENRGFLVAASAGEAR